MPSVISEAGKGNNKGWKEGSFSFYMLMPVALSLHTKLGFEVNRELGLLGGVCLLPVKCLLFFSIFLQLFHDWEASERV